VQGNQQVMLEVKVAEVSKTLVDKLGSELSLTRTMGGTTFTLLGEMLTGTASSITATRPNGRTTLSLDAEIKNGLVKILAEPTIMAMSGQEGTFLAGGKIYIPVPQSSGIGTSSITLEEKEFGVGLRFLPTVLDEGRINLRVSPEVSELSQVGTAVTTGNTTSILPTITTRRASTTVQLRDGESFAIGGLIKHNVTEAVKAMPGVGEMPVLGALFRSTEFQTDRSELLFIVTPRLVKPLPPNAPLPTDNFVEPTRLERLIDGRVESATPPAKPAPAAPVPPAGGFKLN
jgi:pilus assembly protein CpaC